MRFEPLRIFFIDLLLSNRHLNRFPHPRISGDQVQDIGGGHAHNQQAILAGTQLQLAERANESNSLILYLLFNVLFVLMGVRVIQNWGDIAQTVKQQAPTVVDRIVNSFDNATLHAGDYVFDGEWSERSANETLRQQTELSGAKTPSFF